MITELPFSRSLKSHVHPLHTLCTIKHFLPKCNNAYDIVDVKSTPARLTRISVVPLFWPTLSLLRPCRLGQRQEILLSRTPWGGVQRVWVVYKAQRGKRAKARWSRRAEDLRHPHNRAIQRSNSRRLKAEKSSTLAIPHSTSCGKMCKRRWECQSRNQVSDMRRDRSVEEANRDALSPQRRNESDRSHSPSL